MKWPSWILGLLPAHSKELDTQSLSICYCSLLSEISGTLKVSTSMLWFIQPIKLQFSAGERKCCCCLMACCSHSTTHSYSFLSFACFQSRTSLSRIKKLPVFITSVYKRVWYKLLCLHLKHFGFFFFFFNFGIAFVRFSVRSACKFPFQLFSWLNLSLWFNHSVDDFSSTEGQSLNLFTVVLSFVYQAELMLFFHVWLYK